jgi:hypothetical protein
MFLCTFAFRPFPWYNTGEAPQDQPPRRLPFEGIPTRARPRSVDRGLFVFQQEVSIVATIMVQAATEKLLLGQSAGDITAMNLPTDEYHRRIRVSALILCEVREGGAWNYDHMDGKGRTLWSATAGKGRCNVDPSSKHILRG